MFKARAIVSEFQRFILRGNVVDLAVGVIIGAAFGKVVDSVVKDLITPLLGLLGGQPDFSSLRLGPLLVGNFVNVLLSFLIVAAVVFFLIVKPMNTIRELALFRGEAKAPAPLPEDVKLLTEIRDLLRAQAGAPAQAAPRSTLS